MRGVSSHGRYNSRAHSRTSSRRSSSRSVNNISVYGNAYARAPLRRDTSGHRSVPPLGKTVWPLVMIQSVLLCFSCTDHVHMFGPWSALLRVHNTMWYTLLARIIEAHAKDFYQYTEATCLPAESYQSVEQKITVGGSIVLCVTIVISLNTSTCALRHWTHRSKLVEPLTNRNMVGISVYQNPSSKRLRRGHGATGSVTSTPHSDYQAHSTPYFPANVHVRTLYVIACLKSSTSWP